MIPDKDIYRLQHDPGTNIWYQIIILYQIENVKKDYMFTRSSWQFETTKWNRMGSEKLIHTIEIASN